MLNHASKSVFCLACLTLPLATASAQVQPVERFEAEVMQAVGVISQYQKILQNPDLRIQYEAMKRMLATKDPALQRIAKEHGLFSTNPAMREAALIAIFDGGGNIRPVVNGTGAKGKDVLRWVETKGGSHDGRTGSLILAVGPRFKSERHGECWRDPTTRSECLLQVSGDNVQFTTSGSRGSTSQSLMKLGRDGILRGTIVTYESVGRAPLAIDLKE